MATPAVFRTYGPDVRRLINRAFSSAAELPRGVVPGGTIAERLRRWPVHQLGTIALRNSGDSSQDGASLNLMEPAKYWVRALPQRCIVLGPLTELACANLPADENRRAEGRLIRAYERLYLRVPLPAEILDLLKTCAGEAGGADFVRWLDHAREVVMDTNGLDEATAARTRLRRHAVLQGAARQWTERCVSAAELMTDVLLLCSAAHADLAAAIRAASGGCVVDALADMTEAQSVFESALPLVIRPPRLEDAFEEAEHRLVLDYARSRQQPWCPLLVWGSGQAVEEPTTGVSHMGAAHVRSAVIANAASTIDARAEYRRIVSELESHVLGAHVHGVVRRLALVGAGHLSGLGMQRVLVTGATGAGKTHAAVALAKAIGQPYLLVDTSDITATGWMGADVGNVLDDLRDLARRASVPGVLLLDEVDKARADHSAAGVSREAKLNLMSSLLALLAGQPVVTGRGSDQIDTSQILVLGAGAFDGRFRDRPPTTAELVRWGWIHEFAARWGERVCVPMPGRAQAIELLQRSERSVENALNPLAASMQLRIVVPPEVAGYVADYWLRSGTDFRSASELLLATARRRMIEALEADIAGDVVLSPDDVSIPNSPRRGDDEGDADLVPT
jgi:hypothetical protein